MLKLDITILISSIIYIVTFIVLSNLLLKPLVSIIVERKRRSEEARKLAERLMEEAEALKNEYEGRIREVLDGLSREREKRVEEVRRYEREALEHARNEAHRRVMEKKRELEKVEKLKSQTDSIVLDIANEITEKVLRKIA